MSAISARDIAKSELMANASAAAHEGLSYVHAHVSPPDLLKRVSCSCLSCRQIYRTHRCLDI